MAHQAKRTRRLSIAWALLPLLTFGVATPFVVWHAARRLKSRMLALSALAWASAVVISFAMASTNSRTNLVAGVGTTVLITVMIGGTFHAFALRPTVFRLDTLDVDLAAREKALRIVREHPREALRLNIGRVDIPDSERMSDGGLIDINNSSIDAIGRTLGLHPEQMRELEKARIARGGFSSQADLEFELEWDPRTFDPALSRLICLPRLGSPMPALSEHGSIFRADGRTPGRPTGPSERNVRVASYIWAVSPILTGGLAAAPALAFAAARLRSVRLWVLAGGYLTVLLALAFTEGLGGATAWNTVAQWALAAIATTNAFLLRKETFEVDAVRADQRNRREALHLVKTDPQEAIRLQIGRVDIPENQRYPDGGLIDMNNASVEAMASSTGIKMETAQRIAETRSAVWGFSSLDDLCLQLDLVPQVFDAVRDRLVFLPLLSSTRSSHEATESAGVTTQT